MEAAVVPWSWTVWTDVLAPLSNVNASEASYEPGRGGTNVTDSEQ
jgi:hypothetical protein